MLLVRCRLHLLFLLLRHDRIRDALTATRLGRARSLDRHVHRLLVAVSYSRDVECMRAAAL